MNALRTLLNLNVNVEERAAGSQDEQPLSERPLIHAILKQSTDAVKILLSSRESLDIETPDTCGNTTLYCAVAEGCSKIVENLLKANVNVDAPSTGGITPLMKATRRGYLDIVRALLDGGADFNAYSNDGFTCIHHIVWARQPGKELMEEFRRRQISLDMQRRGHGDTVLSTLLRFNNSNMESDEWRRKFHALMNPPVNVNVEDQNCMTPLFHAVFHDLHESASELLQHGAEFGSERPWDQRSWCPTVEMRKLMRVHPQLQRPRPRLLRWPPSFNSRD